MSKLKISAMNVGPLTCDKNLLVAFAQGKVDLPTTAAVIVHPRHGVIVWDTGINEAVLDAEREESYWSTETRDAFSLHAFTREHVIDAQLERLGISPKEVRYVVYSHLHLDHAGGMSYFPGAVHVMQRDEIRYALWPDPWTRSSYCQNDFRDLRKLNILEVDGDFDLFNDGSMKLLKLPGHSPGHQVLMLNLSNRGPICLAADAGHQRDGFESMIPMPFDWSIGAVTMSRMRLQQLERAGVPLFFCHDGSDFAKLPQNGAFWD